LSPTQSQRPMIPHSRPTLGPEEREAVLAVLESGHVAQGPRCREFERAVAERLGVGHACCVSSGLAALHLALLGLGTGPGDEVMLPSLVCEALLHAVHYCGAAPVIVDVESETGNLDAARAAEAASPRTRCVIVPHMFGTPARMDALAGLGLPLLEDCAIAIGAEYRGRKVGSFGAASVLSFYATKVLCTGEGGMVVTDDARLAAAVDDLRDYTGKPDFHTRFNYKMTDLAAAMGIEQLKKLDAFIRRRRELAALYDRLLGPVPGVERPRMDRHGGSIFYRYVVRVPADRRDRVRRYMAGEGVQCGMGVLHPLHRLLPGAAPRPCPVSEEWADRSLSLPIYPLLTDSQARRVAQVLVEAMERA